MARGNRDGEAWGFIGTVRFAQALDFDDRQLQFVAGRR